MSRKREPMAASHWGRDRLQSRGMRLHVRLQSKKDSTADALHETEHMDDAVTFAVAYVAAHPGEKVVVVDADTNFPHRWIPARST